MRCASRTQVKIGLTVARPCWFGWALATLIARAILSTWPRNGLRIAHQFYRRWIAFADAVEIGFFEIAVDPKGVGVDQRNQIFPDRSVVAELRQKISHVAVDRRADLGALQIDPRLIQTRYRLLVSCLRCDGVAFIGLLFLFCHRQLGKLLATLCLTLNISRIDLRLFYGRLGEVDGDFVVGRVDHDQQIALMDELVVGDRQFYDPARDFRRHCHDIDPHCAVARPRRLHIDAPHLSSEANSKHDRDQCQQ